VSSGIARQRALRNRMEEAPVPDLVFPRFQNYQFTVTEPTPLEGTKYVWAGPGSIVTVPLAAIFANKN